jgi:hypothetical protein
LPIQPDGINRIEYFLNGKLVATVKTSPYNYHLDTTKLLNGSYNFTTKTYYANGQKKSVSQTIIVKNKFGWTQFKLRAQKLAWLIILLSLAVGAAVVAWIVHKRGGGSGYSGDSSYDSDVYAGPTDTIPPTPTSSGMVTNAYDSVQNSSSPDGLGQTSIPDVSDWKPMSRINGQTSPSPSTQANSPGYQPTTIVRPTDTSNL